MTASGFLCKQSAVLGRALACPLWYTPLPFRSSVLIPKGEDVLEVKGNAKEARGLDAIIDPWGNTQNQDESAQSFGCL